MRPQVKMTILIFYIFLIAVVLAVVILIVQTLKIKKMEIIFLDVNQGDAILIKTPDQRKILIDGGPDNSVLYQMGKFLPFYDRKIDLIILSHPDADHLTGLIEVLKRYQVLKVLMPAVDCQTAECQAWQNVLFNNHIKIEYANHRGSFWLGNQVALEIIKPDLASPEKTVNNNSIVARLIFANTSVLFMGDYEKEESLNQGVSFLLSDIIKISHHGAREANDCNFLTTVNPRYAVISVGQDNKYGHPHSETLDCLNNLKIKTLRTDQLGNIILTTNGQDLSFVPDRGNY